MGRQLTLVKVRSMYKQFVFCLIFVCDFTISQDLGGSSTPLEGDVDTRLFNLNLGGIGESAIGTVIGNAATGFINDCFGKRKRSIFMDRMVNKRSPQEVTQDDVNTRLFCLNNNQGGLSISRPNCRYCYCSDRSCQRYCNKCNNNNNYGFSCNNCNCRSDNRCYNTCDKCYNSNNNNFGNNYGSLNCNTCSCSWNNCFNTCRKCVNNYNFGSGNFVNCNTCSCSYDQNCRNKCNCYSYGNNYWRNGVRARNEGEAEQPQNLNQNSQNSGSSNSDGIVFA